MFLLESVEGVLVLLVEVGELVLQMGGVGEGGVVIVGEKGGHVALGVGGRTHTLLLLLHCQYLVGQTLLEVAVHFSGTLRVGRQRRCVPGHGVVRGTVGVYHSFIVYLEL